MHLFGKSKQKDKSKQKVDIISIEEI